MSWSSSDQATTSPKGRRLSRCPDRYQGDSMNDSVLPIRHHPEVPRGAQFMGILARKLMLLILQTPLIFFCYWLVDVASTADRKAQQNIEMVALPKEDFTPHPKKKKTEQWFNLSSEQNFSQGREVPKWSYLTVTKEFPSPEPWATSI